MRVLSLVSLACLAPVAALAALQFSVEQHTEVRHPTRSMTVYTTTFRSQPFPLKDGQVLFTRPQETPLSMPDSNNGSYAILSFVSDVGDDKNQSVSLDRVYTHHWIAEQKGHVNEFCKTGPNFVFGIGAESRKTPIAFPDGYGYVVEPDNNQWGGNIHLLHTKSLSLDLPGGRVATSAHAAKQCNECYYAPDKGPQCDLSQNGTFLCCGDRCYDGSCRCPTTQNASTTATNFYLKYTVQYTYDIKAIIAVKASTFTTPHCQTFYEVLRNNDQPESLSSVTGAAPFDMDLVFAIGHQHTGALNISTFVNDKLLCASMPRYGKQVGVPGDELDHLVEMSSCFDAKDNGVVHIKQGDQVRVDGWYYVGDDDPRLSPGLGGSHLNVMSYMTFYYYQTN